MKARNLFETLYLCIPKIRHQSEDVAYLCHGRAVKPPFQGAGPDKLFTGDVQGKPWCRRKRCAQCCRWHPSLCDGAEPVPEGRRELGALCEGEPCTSCSTGVKLPRSAGVPALPQLKNLSSPFKTPGESRALSPCHQ